MIFRRCVSLDFDGVLHSYENGWGDGSVYGTIDLSGAYRIINAGYAVAIVTARDVPSVAAAVKKVIEDGYGVEEDLVCATEFWHGGIDGHVIVVTNRKVAAIAYVDDRAIAHRYGDSWDEVMASVEALAVGWQ